MIKNELVSIVTPVYNAEKYLEETVKSVQAQTYENWELFLIDDGSKDGSLKIAKKLAKSDKRINVISIDNSGAAFARNIGISKASGRYLCFIDADDLWMNDKLEKQVAFMKEKDCAFSFTGYVFGDKNAKPTDKVVYIPTSIDYKQALKNTTIWTSTVMFDMTKLSKDDVLMPDIPSEDTATWWRVLKNVECAYGLDESLSIYRRSGKTLSSNKLVAIRRIWKLYRDYEGLNLMQSLANFVGYATNAVRRRV